jgi:prepilin-type N-terminal cleavage/methylation domain-containing protein
MIGAGNSNPRQTHENRRGFTLIEILVCIGIIVILAAFLLPAVNRARESAREPVCQNNLRQLMLGFRAFAHDHTDQLPGGYWDLRFKTDPDPSHWDWLRGNWSQWTSAPAGGTLFRYVNQSAALYRCPALSLQAMSASAIGGPGVGSNGQYDYVSMLDLVGARMAAVRFNSRLVYPDGHVAYVPTPVIVEGNPAQVNGFQFTSWHAGDDTMSHAHHGGAFYAAIDGSVQWVNEPVGGCWIWQSQAPSGTWVTFGPYPFFWGQWNQQ